MEIQTNNDQQLQYEIAATKVKKIARFYRHLGIYCIVNLFIVYVNIQNLNDGESYFQLKNFTTAFFWGIGLTAHGLGIFASDLFFGAEWEKRKIKQIMQKEQLQTQKWS